MKAIISWLHPPPLTHTHPHTLSHTPALLMATCKPENSSHMQTNICHSHTHMHIYIFTHTHTQKYPCTHAHTHTHTLNSHAEIQRSKCVYACVCAGMQKCA